MLAAASIVFIHTAIAGWAAVDFKIQKIHSQASATIRMDAVLCFLPRYHHTGVIWWCLHLLTIVLQWNHQAPRMEKKFLPRAVTSQVVGLCDQTWNRKLSIEVPGCNWERGSRSMEIAFKEVARLRRAKLRASYLLNQLLLDGECRLLASTGLSEAGRLASARVFATSFLFDPRNSVRSQFPKLIFHRNWAHDRSHCI